MAVKWDTTYEQSVAPQKPWATVTIARVSDTLLETIVGKKPKPVVVDATYRRIAAAIERKGQTDSVRAAGNRKNLPGQAIRRLVVVEPAQP